MLLPVRTQRCAGLERIAKGGFATGARKFLHSLAGIKSGHLIQCSDPMAP